MTASNRRIRTGAAYALLLWSVAGGLLDGEEPALRLRASAAGSPAPLTIELFRWSSDADREMVTAALAAPAQAFTPAPTPTPAAPAAGRGRGGRGGGQASAPASPLAKLTAAIKAAPTLGFIWGDGPTGYSIRYAWRAAPVDGQERVVFVTDRRLGAHILPVPAAPAGSTDVEFTVIEARIGGKGAAQLEVTR